MASRPAEGYAEGPGDTGESVSRENGPLMRCVGRFWLVSGWVVLRLGDTLDREGAPDALERVAGHLGEVGPSGADGNEVVPADGRRELDGEVGAPTVRFARNCLLERTRGAEGVGEVLDDAFVEAGHVPHDPIPGARDQVRDVDPVEVSGACAAGVRLGAHDVGADASADRDDGCGVFAGRVVVGPHGQGVHTIGCDAAVRGMYRHVVPAGGSRLERQRV